MSQGLLSSPAFIVGTFKGNGILYNLVSSILPGLAKAIVAPGAQDVTSGGSLATALQNFGAQLINGWPSPGALITTGKSEQRSKWPS